jgi:hypothetical protein
MRRGTRQKRPCNFLLKLYMVKILSSYQTSYNGNNEKEQKQSPLEKHKKQKKSSKSQIIFYKPII